MSDQAVNALLAIVLGTGLALLLLGPVAAVQYRRDGRFGLGDLVALVGGAVYGLALWTYTLLPLPVSVERCAGRQLVPFASLGDLEWAGPATMMRDPAFLQVVLNVALFVPLGLFVHLILRRGVLATTVLGFAISLLIECTQGTGLWGLYRCAYRVFDVDDLIANTLGAFLGSVLVALVTRGHGVDARPVPTTISTGRRWTGMACDAIFVLTVGGVAAIAWRVWQLYVADRSFDELDTTVQTVLQWGVPGAIEAAVVLLSGRTIGEAVINVRTESDRRWPLALARLVKLATGIGAYVALMLAGFPGSVVVLAAFALVSVVAVPLSDGRRGLSNAAAGLRLVVDSRAGRTRATGRRPSGPAAR